MKKKNDRAASRPGLDRDEDSRAGDEGLEEDLSTARSRQSNERMEGSPARSSGSNVRSDDVRDPSSINRSTERHRSSDSSQSFEGQGGQKGGSQQRSNQGTGYTKDRSSQLQEDDSLSSSPGRQSKSGSRNAESPRKNVSPREEHEESERSRDDVDRSLM
jgi:hypothetical protein